MNGDQGPKFYTLLGILLTIVSLAACNIQPKSGTEPSPEYVETAAPPTSHSSTVQPTPKVESTAMKDIQDPAPETATSRPQKEEPTGTVQELGEEHQEETTSARLLAEIDFFEAAPSILHPGESTELRWRATGAAAEICPITRYTYFSDDDCQSVPLTGSLPFIIPDDLRPSYEPGFRLRVLGEEGTDSQQAYVYVNLYCPINWFFDPEPASGPLCPQEPISSWTAIQHFEHGTMIWMESLGRYSIFRGKPISQMPSDHHEQFTQINDPLIIESDTTSEFTAPEGLYAPESGFGLVWRGDVADSPPLLETLGWAAALEIGYEAAFQCSDYGSTQFGAVCYRQGSEGELIWMDMHYQRWLRVR